MSKRRYLLTLGIVLSATLLVGGCSSRLAGAGDVVQVHYTGTLADGTEFDSSIGREPLEFTLGARQTIPGFENAVYGMKVGQRKTITIPAEEAYGPYQDDLVMEVERNRLPPGQEPAAGQHLIMTYPDGRNRQATITEVTESTVTVDANHPLAGKDLTFEIRLVGIR